MVAGILAASDAELETLWTTMQREFHDNQRRTIQAVQRKAGYAMA